MKINIFLLLIILNFNVHQTNNELLVNELRSVCQNQPDGSRIAVNTDCNKFHLCDGGLSLTLSCRSAEPYFDRCNSKCVNDIAVCQIRDCNGPQTTTSAPITFPIPTTTTTQTTTKSTTTSITSQSTTTSTTQPIGSTITTTRYIAPTVPTAPITTSTTSTTTTLAPVGCTPTCNPENYPALNCDCAEQYQCLVNDCRCDTSIECPIMCPDECGCIENCDCLPSGQCTCKNDGTKCPFDSSQCTRICGCDANCDCVEGPTRCICLEECNCISHWDCAFHPSECEETCGCTERCEDTCIGNFCKCDGNRGCPGWKI